MARFHRLIAEKFSARGKPLAHYASGVPTAQHIADLFTGEWVSRFPDGSPAASGGDALLFEDARLAWGIAAMGGVADKRVIELGPLEGGHSYMLQRAGATLVHAVEANRRAFLRCLAVKEMFALDRVGFLLGDFVAYLRSTSETYDIAVASGVLYHMANPAELVALLAARAPALYCWTHYYDERIAASHAALRRRRAALTSMRYGDFSYTAYRMRYGVSRHCAGFCGAGAPGVSWLTRQDIERCCRHFGYTSFDVAFDEPDHPNGPTLAFVAQKVEAVWA